jgi:isopentenyl diphosphate isomerase/L-lactate dehydrogenase-like FMN-dependent dehydrogenase
MTRASRKVASPRVVCIDDLRPVARRRVPKAVFDYLDGGAEGEVTLRENCRAFEDVTFRPRHAVAIAECDLRTRVLGLDLALPFLLGPVGYSRLMHSGGEVAAARAAGARFPTCFLQDRTNTDRVLRLHAGVGEVRTVVRHLRSSRRTRLRREAHWETGTRTGIYDPLDEHRKLIRVRAS